MESPVLPTIISIEPSEAGPGEEITIRGTGLTGEGLSVAFDGVPAQVISATATAVVVIIPGIPQGDHSVTVAADGRASTPFRYGVAAVLLPTITAIEPTGAHAWDEITISGRNFLKGTQAPPPSVLVGGVAARVGFATPSRLVVNVPVVARGSTTVQVRSGVKVSGEFPFEVLHSPPIVASVTPNPARVGLSVTILGQHLAGPETSVLVDGSPVAIRPLTGNTEIVAMIPPVTTGVHNVQVRVEGDLAPPIPLQIDDFDATGIYDVRSVVLASRSAAVCPDVGTVRAYTIELIDRRPELTVRIGLGPRNLNGSIDSAGQIRAVAFTCNPFLCGFDPAFRVLGQVDRREGGGYQIDASIDWDDPCMVRDHVTGVRR